MESWIIQKATFWDSEASSQSFSFVDVLNEEIPWSLKWIEMGNHRAGLLTEQWIKMQDGKYILRPAVLGEDVGMQETEYIWNYAALFRNRQTARGERRLSGDSVLVRDKYNTNVC